MIYIIFFITILLLIFIKTVYKNRKCENLPSVKSVKNLYEKSKNKSDFYKFFWNKKPTIILTNLDLIKSVLVTDFKNFSRRDDFFDENDRFKSSHLANLYGEKWKMLRSFLGKGFNACALDNLVRKCLKMYKKDPTYLDSINTNLNDLVYSKTITGTLCMAFDVFQPKLGTKIYKFLFEKKDTNFREDEFFLEVVDEIESLRREKKNLNDKSFFSLLMQLKSSGKISALDVAAQSYVFFSAGTESVALLVLYCLYELALNPEVQEKLREEIQELSPNNNDITKESLKDMVYLNNCLKGEFLAIFY